MTTATINDHIAQCEPFLAGPHDSVVAQFRRRLGYYEALRQADEEGQRIPALILFDILLTDDEWTEQTLLENVPDYVLSVLQAADRDELDRNDDQAYMLDLTDGCVYLPTPEVLAAIRGLDDIPAATTVPKYLVMDGGTVVSTPSRSKVGALKSRDALRAAYKPEYQDRVQVVEIRVVDE